MNAMELKQKYIDWLNQEIQINEVNNYLEVTSPFLDRYNDYLQVYINIANNNNIYISDDGYTVNNLKMSGISIDDSKKRQELLNMFLKKYGVKISKDELFVTCTSKDFPQKTISLMQAMLNIDDMFMLSQNKVSSLFNEDITNFFNNNDIYYTENVNFVGKSGLYYSYDYLLQRTKNKPERLCKAINNPNLQNFKNNAFMWSDTKETRNSDSKFIVLLNDNSPINTNVIEGFKNYDIEPILWSERNNKIDLLTA